MKLLDAFKQLVGLTPRDLREVWHEKPLVIVDVNDAVVFSGMATIEYTPDVAEYEKGHANVFDEANGGLLISAEIVKQRVYSSVDQSNPYRLRWSRLGLTANAVDGEGRALTFFIGRHAHNYLLRSHGSILGVTGDMSTMPFPEEPEDIPPGDPMGGQGNARP